MANDAKRPSAAVSGGRSTIGIEPHAVLLTAIACLGLALAMAVYIADRDAARAMLMPDVGAHAGRKIFGAIGQWLPSFVHPFSFSLFTAAALPARSTPRYGACVAWAVVNAAFEVGQHPSVSIRLANALQGAPSGMPFSQALSRYFVHGTFDPLDLVAVLFGSLAAALVLRHVPRATENAHAG